MSKPKVMVVRKNSLRQQKDLFGRANLDKWILNGATVGLWFSEGFEKHLEHNNADFNIFNLDN